MRFGMFYLNEYAGLTIMSMVAVTLFFGGWHGPFGDARSTSGASTGSASSGSSSRPTSWSSCWSGSASRIPRLQVDQLMAFAWKILIPLGLVNILATAAIMLWVPQLEVGPGRVRLGRVLRLRGPVRPDPQVAPAPAA